MKITKMTAEAFIDMRGGQQRGAKPSDLVQAVYDLQEGEAFQTPCKWNHTSLNGCGGSNTVNTAARRRDFGVRTTCRNGIFYVMKVPK